MVVEIYCAEMRHLLFYYTDIPTRFVSYKIHIFLIAEPDLDILENDNLRV